MTFNKIAKLLLKIPILILFSGCIFPIQYPESKPITIDKRLIGSWEKKLKSGNNSYYEAKISKIDEKTYEIDLYQEYPFVEKPMIFHLTARGYLFKNKNFLMGQFKIVDFPDMNKKEKKDVQMMINTYIIGVFGAIEKDSFQFYALGPEQVGLSLDRNANITTEKLRAAIDNALETKIFLKREYHFIRTIE